MMLARTGLTGPPCGVPISHGVILSPSCIGALRILWMSETTRPSLSLSDKSCRSLEWLTVSKNFDRSRSTTQT